MPATDTFGKFAATDSLARPSPRRASPTSPCTRGTSQKRYDFFDEGISVDLAAKNGDRAAMKLAALAYAQMSRSEKDEVAPLSASGAEPMKNATIRKARQVNASAAASQPATAVLAAG